MLGLVGMEVEVEMEMGKWVSISEVLVHKVHKKSGLVV
jgi:hypothetical protein